MPGGGGSEEAELNGKMIFQKKGFVHCGRVTPAPTITQGCKTAVSLGACVPFSSYLHFEVFE